MSVMGDILNSFNTGFLRTNIQTRNPIKLELNTPDELKDFNDTFKEVSKEAVPEPPLTNAVLQGYRIDENNNEVPTEIIIKGVRAQETFFDENGNWDTEKEELSYRKKKKNTKRNLSMSG